MSTPAQGSPPPPRQSLLPVVIAFLLAGGAVLALGIWASSRDSEELPLAPEIELIEPAAGDVVDLPVALLFRTAGPLRLEPSGWQAGPLHLHALVDGRELMPGAADVQALGDDRFRWTLPPIEPGTHELRLLWAGPDHRPLLHGATPPISFTVR